MLLRNFLVNSGKGVKKVLRWFEEVDEKIWGRSWQYVGKVSVRQGQGTGKLLLIG